MMATKPHGPNAGHWRKKQARPIAGKCPVSGKLSFATRAKARKELRHYQGASSSCAVYQCWHCGQWHLTSHPYGRSAA